MKRVVKGNKELRIEDYALQGYLDNGWNQIDDSGKIIKEGANKNNDSAKVKKLEAEKLKLTTQVAELTGKLDASNSAVEKLQKANDKLKADLVAAKKK